MMLGWWVRYNRNAILAGVVWNVRTVWPDGFDTTRFDLTWSTAETPDGRFSPGDGTPCV